MKPEGWCIAEIGSTTTLVNLVFRQGTEVRLLAQGVAPTSVEAGDVTLGLEAARQEAVRLSGLQPEVVAAWPLLATSSAAGGLKMTVHGLVYEMTARAAREAALGAGAVVRLVTAGLLKPEDLEEVAWIEPRLIMLAGGTDYGEEATVWENAQRLAAFLKEKGPVPVVYAGNCTLRSRVSRLWQELGLPLYLTDNVYPRIDELQVEPARRIIQQAFEEHIIQGPGWQKLGPMLARGLMPTPGAVLQAAELLAAAIGDLLVLDVGGATTDVHSVTAGAPENLACQTEPEPYAKRTVEGDLGVYRNAEQVAALLPAGLLPANWRELLAPLPQTAAARQVSLALTEQAVKTAIERHAGRYRWFFGPTGRQKTVTGKDLSRVQWIIGTGGALTRLPGGEEILARQARGPRGQWLLPPATATILLDRNYIMAAAGALAGLDRQAALALLRSSLKWERKEHEHATTDH